MNTSSKGKFITFEGGEGAGKTTQIKLLSEKLSSDGFDVVLTREPGGVPEAEKIRDLLVHRDGGDWDALSECLLLFAARRMHIENLIKPALAQGKIVLCDRFTDSTIAYQGYGHGFHIERIREIESLSIHSFSPDLTFIMDLPVEKGLARAGRRLERDQSGEDKNEMRPVDFHEALRQGFLEIAAQNIQRCHVIDAMQSVDVIANEVYAIFTSHE